VDSMRTWKLSGFSVDSMQSWEAERLPCGQHANLEAKRVLSGGWAYQFVKCPVGVLAFRCAVELLLALLAPFHCVRCLCFCLRLSGYEVCLQTVPTGDEQSAQRLLLHRGLGCPNPAGVPPVKISQVHFY
jgi:hypothetical protein